MSVWRIVTRDIAAALAVLAIVFFSLNAVASPSHSFAFDSYGASSVASTGYCGDAQGDKDHRAPCHACRADAVALPPPPCVSEGLILVSANTDAAVQAAVGRHSAVFVANSPRAPPSVG